jgi:CRISPR/Cas system-associated endonuclease/helicase Cas3
MILTPSENYARAKTISKFPKTKEFSESFPFELDDFQIQACHALEQGKGVLVAAPTGAGKTIVGEFAVDLVINSSGKCFYTTPIKALSNQKYSELCQKYGEDRIGLLTGDVSNNSEAQIVVMTTEVLRNMIYSNSPTISDLKYVVMDEVHYLADKFRGAVWEEILSLIPESPPYYDKEEISDRPMRFFISEIIREKIFIHCQKEIPYSTQVEVEEYKEEPGLTRIRANIIVERDSQRGIIIGRGGEMLKRIGKAARLDMEKFLETKVFLENYVKVDKDWRHSDAKLKKYGY